MGSGGVAVEVTLSIPASELLAAPEPQRRAILDGIADLYAAVGRAPAE